MGNIIQRSPHTSGAVRLNNLYLAKITILNNSISVDPNKLKTNQIKIKVLIGYVIGILGLIMLIWNAYIYLSQSGYNKISLVAGLLFCIIGAVLIKKNKNKNTT